MKVLVTGGAGYIGSHTVLELLRGGYEVVVVDDYENSKPEALRRVRELAGRDFAFENVDLRDPARCDDLFVKYEIDSVIHFAGLKAVGESVRIPLDYYTDNLFSTLNLLNSMKKHGVTDFVFSSSATVYGEPKIVPIPETSELFAVSPYARTKLMIEDILRTAAHADPTLNAAILRYFNPIGADESGRIGEDPNGIPNNLVPYVAQVAVGKLKELTVYGDDYATPDGTGVRDYIHVTDLALGHIAALKKLRERPGLVTYNLGTGHGYTVLDIVAAYESACGKKIPYHIAARREGDVPVLLADVTKAKNELGFVAERDLARMCLDSWNWQKNNPDGYGL